MLNCHSHGKSKPFSCGNMECAVECIKCFAEHLELLGFLYTPCPFCNHPIEIDKEFLKLVSDTQKLKFAQRTQGLLMLKNTLIVNLEQEFDVSDAGISTIKDNSTEGDNTNDDDLNIENIADFLCQSPTNQTQKLEMPHQTTSSHDIKTNTIEINKHKQFSDKRKKTQYIAQINADIENNEGHFLAMNVKRCKNHPTEFLYEEADIKNPQLQKYKMLACKYECEKICPRCFDIHPASFKCSINILWWNERSSPCSNCGTINFLRENLDTQICTECKCIYMKSGQIIFKELEIPVFKDHLVANLFVDLDPIASEYASRQKVLYECIRKITNELNKEILGTINAKSKFGQLIEKISIKTPENDIITEEDIKDISAWFREIHTHMKLYEELLKLQKDHESILLSILDSKNSTDKHQQHNNNNDKLVLNESYLVGVSQSIKKICSPLTVNE